jgi:hypothetical protein
MNMSSMNAGKTIGAVLIAAGIAGLAVGSFSVTKETHQAQVGPLTVMIQDQNTMTVPMWAGIGSIVLGGALLLLGFKRN